MLQLATLSDRADINQIASQVHTMHVSWRPDIYEMSDELYSEDRFFAAIKNRQIYSAIMDNKVIGYVFLRTHSIIQPGAVRRKIMIIEEFCVHESYRNQGIGKQMMEDVQALAKAFLCNDLQLGVYPQNDAAIAFYQKCGFMIHNINMQRKI